MPVKDSNIRYIQILRFTVLSVACSRNPALPCPLLTVKALPAGQVSIQRGMQTTEWAAEATQAVDAPPLPRRALPVIKMRVARTAFPVRAVSQESPRLVRATTVPVPAREASTTWRRVDTRARSMLTNCCNKDSRYVTFHKFFFTCFLPIFFGFLKFLCFSSILLKGLFHYCFTSFKLTFNQPNFTYMISCGAIQI